jgi:riboflavin transporter FmnP
MGLKVILSLKGGKMKKYNLGDFVFGAILFAIIVLMAFVPSLGFIPIIPGVAYATLLHIPVLIGAIFLGWKWGLVLGLPKSWSKAANLKTKSLGTKFTTFRL